MVTKSRDGEFIGLGIGANFLKEKIDLAHCRGYAVLVIRATSADDPDDKAVYNMYQVDANKGRAVSDMYEALRELPKPKDILAEAAYTGGDMPKSWIRDRGNYTDGYNQALKDVAKLRERVLAKAEGKEKRQ